MAPWEHFSFTVFGTDYPFFGPQNLHNCLKVVQSCQALSKVEKQVILTETPARLFGINLSSPDRYSDLATA